MEVGDLPRLTVEWRNLEGALTEPTKVELEITTPAGVVSKPTPTKTSTAIWHYDLSVTEQGTYSYHWTATGTLQASERGQFAVGSPIPPVEASAISSTEYRDRLRRAIQDGQTSSGEALAMARLEDLSEQVMQQSTPTGKQFQVRFAGVPTQNLVAAFVVPSTLVAFVDGQPAPVTPTVDVDSSGLFTLPNPPAETLQVTYAWQYFQDGSIEAFLQEARAWVQGPGTFSGLAEVPDGLSPALIDFAASRALRSLAAKIALASAKSGDSSMDFGALMKEYRAQADSRESAASAERKSYWGRSDQPLAPASSVGEAGYRNYQPRR